MQDDVIQSGGHLFTKADKNKNVKKPFNPCEECLLDKCKNSNSGAKFKKMVSVSFELKL